MRLSAELVVAEPISFWIQYNSIAVGPGLRSTKYGDDVDYSRMLRHDCREEGADL